ncbi:unnamed protein product [Cladocopium goreaui]|uniref:Serine/threonine-protein phosphatase 6 regulatory ankyrin repeat subunit B (PP6-ARS-B) (Serine/threonine-protein phosphatase 6 regulatory subunit ARS-B) (Ankyrin repeat domain-containing protein 44) n=1 Tax=Cladocopium goreaui TaxID=2562237 RepID=A0A9P1DWX1_9DINO|nr:unnamed protein product [Cladocopium goreaui]
MAKADGLQDELCEVEDLEVRLLQTLGESSTMTKTQLLQPPAQDATAAPATPATETPAIATNDACKFNPSWSGCVSRWWMDSMDSKTGGFSSSKAPCFCRSDPNNLTLRCIPPAAIGMVRAILVAGAKVDMVVMAPMVFLLSLLWTASAVRPAVESLGPLHQAAAKGQATAIEVLVEDGEDVNGKDSEGRTPLWQAVSHQQLLATEKLLELGATDLDQEWMKKTLLGVACYEGYPVAKLVETLLEHKADVNKADGYGKTPLSYAKSRGAYQIEEATAPLNWAEGDAEAAHAAQVAAAAWSAAASAAQAARENSNCFGDGSLSQNLGCPYHVLWGTCVVTAGCNWHGESALGGWCTGGTQCTYQPVPTGCMVTPGCRWQPATAPLMVPM